MYKFFLLCFLGWFSQLTFAETCPSVHSIKTQGFQGWQIRDSEEDALLSAERAAQFKANVVQFALAEWVKHKPAQNIIHCYYLDKHGSSMEAYLAKTDLVPIKNRNVWYKVTGSIQCAAAMEKCSFQGQTNTHLARK